MRHKNRLLTRAATVAAALGVYAVVLRPRLLRWGATPAETQRPLPGDDLVPSARSVSTRVVTVDASQMEVWPWLVQMGQGRGGLYSYDWLENLVGCDIHSAARIIPELQHVALGDAIRLVPEDAAVPLVLNVAILEPGRALVLKTPGGPSDYSKGLPLATWAFVIEGTGESTTRLLVRWRSDYRPTIRGLLVNQYYSNQSTS